MLRSGRCRAGGWRDGAIDVVEDVILGIGPGGIRRAGPVNAGQKGIGSVRPEWVVIGAGPEGVRQDVAVQIRPEDGPIPSAPAMPRGTRVMGPPAVPPLAAPHGGASEPIR